MASTPPPSVIIGGIIILAAVITGAFTIMAPFVVNNDPNYREYNKTYSVFTEVNQNRQAMENPIKSATLQENPILGVINGLMSLAFAPFILLWDAATIMNNMLISLTTSYFQIPIWFAQMIEALIGSALVFGVIAIWYHWVS